MRFLQRIQQYPVNNSYNITRFHCSPEKDINQEFIPVISYKMEAIKSFCVTISMQMTKEKDKGIKLELINLYHTQTLFFSKF